MARRDRNRASAAALVVSVLIHLALLVWFARQAAPELFTAAERNSPIVELNLASLPSAPPGEPARQASAPKPARAERPRLRTAFQPRIAAPAPQPVRPRPTPRRRSPPPFVAPFSASASAGAGAPAAPARPSPSPPSPWAVQEPDGQDGVRGFLRSTVGCSHEDYLHLNDAERQACDRRLGRDGREAAARVDALPADARAAFDAEIQARERRRAAGTGPVDAPVESCQSEGGALEHGCLNLPERRPNDRP